jgi:hypothetical protein
MVFYYNRLENSPYYIVPMGAVVPEILEHNKKLIDCGIHGRPYSEYPCDDHTHPLAYINSYNSAVQGEVHGLNNPPAACSMGDNATHQQTSRI